MRKQQEREQRRRYEEMEQLRREEERRHAEREQVGKQLTHRCRPVAAPRCASPPSCRFILLFLLTVKHAVFTG